MFSNGKLVFCSFLVQVINPSSQTELKKEMVHCFSDFFLCNFKFYNRKEKNTCFGGITCKLRNKAVCLEVQLKSEFDSALAWFPFHTKVTPLKSLMSNCDVSLHTLCCQSCTKGLENWSEYNPLTLGSIWRDSLTPKRFKPQLLNSNL